MHAAKNNLDATMITVVIPAIAAQTLQIETIDLFFNNRQLLNT